MSEVRRLSMPTMLSFGFGNIAEGIKSTAYGAFLLFFYQQVLGLSGSLAGLALAISVLSDAISDPLVGQFSDRFQTKWGRRHPLIAASAIPLAISFFLLFNPPTDLSQIQLFSWLVCFAVFARISITFYDIPHLALGAEMAHDYEQRTTLFTISTLFRIASGALITFTAYELFFPTTESERGARFHFSGKALHPARVACSDFSRNLPACFVARLSARLSLACSSTSST